MYEGSLYQLPVEFNAADMYLSDRVLEAHGRGLPGPRLDPRRLHRAAAGDETQSNGAQVHSVLLDQPSVGRCGPVALRQRHQPPHRVQGAGRRVAVGLLLSGPRGAAGAAATGGRHRRPTDARVAEVYDYLASLIQEGLCTTRGRRRPEPRRRVLHRAGRGHPRGRLLGGRLAPGRHEGGRLRRPVLPALAHPAAREYGAAGYALLRTSKLRAEAWEFIKYTVRKDTLTRLFETNQTHSGAPLDGDADRYRETGPDHWQVFYDTLDKFPDHRPHPRPAAGR